MGNYIDRLKELISDNAGGKHTVFAKTAKIPTSTFQYYVDGRMPSPEHLIRICECYGVNINWLLTGKGDKYIKREDSLIYKVEDDDPETAGLLSMTRKILKSSTDYSASLAANVRSFYHAIKTEKQLGIIESRLEILEKRLPQKSEDENIEKKVM